MYLHYENLERIRPLAKELEHILCFHVTPPGDLDLEPMTKKIHPAELKLSCGNEIVDGQTRVITIGHPHPQMRGP
jgi:hypothetical protein